MTGCTRAAATFGTSDCAPSVWVRQVGDSYLIGFQGELRGGAAPALQAFDTGSGVATITARRDGLQYATLELLDLTIGSGNDVVNVRGTVRSRTPTCTPARATTGSTSRRWPPCR